MGANNIGNRNAAVVKQLVPRLCSLGEAGVTYLGELLNEKDLGLVADMLEIMHSNGEMFENGCSPLLPIASTLARILVDPAAHVGAFTPATPEDVQYTIRSQNVALSYLGCLAE